jgi:hypothetical protein
MVRRDFLFTCFAVLGQIEAWACCDPDPTEKAIETPYFRIVAPRALFATLDRSGAAIDFAVSRNQIL